jgi:hypothetical protein
MWHAWGRGEVHAGFWWGNLRDRDHLEDPVIDQRIISEYILKNGISSYGWD